MDHGRLFVRPSIPPSESATMVKLSKEVIMTTLKIKTTAAVPSPFAHLLRQRPGKSGLAVDVLLALTRISLGWIFLWAFLDKLFGLGHDTPSSKSWLNGGSPTKGFLKNSAAGPFKGFYHDIAGATWADWLFMVGLAAIGVALILGIGMWAAAVGGAALLVMMWSVVLPPANNPFMDDHLVYAVVLILLAAMSAGRSFGLGGLWERTGLVRGRPYLA
jgi:thiosulfate dehydrogenase [quinone] large subunit